MQKPERPIPSDCCNSGCSICVYDLYNDRLKAYKLWKENQQEEQAKADHLKNKVYKKA